MINWPAFITVTERGLGLAPHTRGEAPDDAPMDVARGSRALWRAQIAVAPMRALEAFAFRAFLTRLRGAFIPVMMPVNLERYSTTYTDGATFSDGSTYTSAAALVSVAVAGTFAAGATAIPVSGFFEPGDLAEIRDIDGAQAVRVTGYNGSVLTFTGPLRRAFVNPSVSTGAIEIPMRLASETPPVPIIAGHRSPEVSLQLEEFEP